MKEEVTTMAAQFLAQSAAAKEVMEEFDRKAALDMLQNSGYVDEEGNVTAKLLKKAFKLVKGAEKNICCRVKFQFLYSQLVQAGFEFAFAKGNREINSGNVDRLKEDVLTSKNKCFEEAGKVIPASVLLNEGIEVFDMQNNPITKDTPNLDKILAIIDCQHRIAACMEDPTIDLLLEIAEYDSSTVVYINRLNNTRKEWDGNDMKHSVRVQHQGHVDTLDEIERLKNRFGVTDKYAECALTGKVDQFRRDELIRIQAGNLDPATLPKYKIEQSKVDEAYNIMYATRCAFNKEKLVNKLEDIDAITNIKGYCINDQAKTYARDVTCYIAKIDSVEARKITSKVAAGDTNALRKYVWKQYQAFCSAHKDDMDKVYEEVLVTIDGKKAEMDKANQSTKTKRLRTGNISDILANRKKLAEEKAAKEAKNANKNAVKSQGEPASQSTAQIETSAPSEVTPEAVSTPTATSVATENEENK